ncbi:MAG: hypothetical protein ACSHYA_03335 [Opitutaceae bacterium]
MKIFNAEALSKYKEINCYASKVFFDHHSAFFATTETISDDIRIYEFSTMELLQRLNGHEKPINDLEFINKGKMIVSGGEDGKILFWDIESGEIANLIDKAHTGLAVNGITVSSTGETLLSCGNDANIKAWNLFNSNDLWLDTSFEIETNSENQWFNISEKNFEWAENLSQNLYHSRQRKTVFSPNKRLSLDKTLKNDPELTNFYFTVNAGDYNSAINQLENSNFHPGEEMVQFLCNSIMNDCGNLSDNKKFSSALLLISYAEKAIGYSTDREFKTSLRYKIFQEEKQMIRGRYRNNPSLEIEPEFAAGLPG